MILTQKHWQRLKDVFNELDELSPTARKTFLSNLQIEEKTIFNELAKLLEAKKETGGFLQNSVSFESEKSLIGETIGHYRIVREIGRGGMGTVFEAVREDGEFDQRAAVKLTNRNLFSDELITRFRRERQILALLEHKNIVRLLDGGINANHIPYYVMEYVEGKTITDYCTENYLGINERLELFLQICQAVGFAHRQLIIHRDLKPSNILVTQYGQVKLLDFGIAKILDSEDQTLTVNAPLTPEYAAPEQIKGEMITTAADIYSLGVILFELLTGKPPCEIYGEKTKDILRGVCESEPVRPSSVVIRAPQIEQNLTAENCEQKTNSQKAVYKPKSLRGDLDNIILKCLQKDKDLRYASVEQFADDIKAYLKGLPVRAHPPSLLYRVRKFFKRNRLSAAFAAIFALLLTAAAAVAIWQFFVARHERRIAEHNFNQVRKIANSLIFDYHDEIAKLDGSTKLREKLVVDALDYLNAVSSENTDNPELLKEIAVAYRKIADVQGRAYAANLGQTEESLKNYRKSAELLEKAAELAPTDIAIKDELAASYNSLMEYRGWNGQPPSEIIQKTKTINEEIIRLAPENLKRKIAWLRLKSNLVTKMKEHQEKVDVFQEILADGQNLLTENPQDAELVSVLRIVTERLGTEYKGFAIDTFETGDVAGSINRFQRGFEYYKLSLDYMNLQQSLDPADNRNKRRFFVAYLNLSTILICLERIDEAESYLEKGNFFFNEMKTGDAANKETRMDELDILKNKNLILQARGNFKEAFRLARTALQFAKELHLQDKENNDVRGLLGLFYQETLLLSEKIKDKDLTKKYSQEYANFKKEYREKFNKEFKINKFSY